MQKQNLEIIYDEVVEIHRYQQQGVDLVYNKLNWILVSDFVFLTAVFSLHHRNVLVILLISASIITSMIGFGSRTFKSTKQISKMLEEKNDQNFLEKLIEKKVEAFNKNKNTLKGINANLYFSQFCLSLAVIMQLVLLITKI